MKTLLVMAAALFLAMPSWAAPSITPMSGKDSYGHTVKFDSSLVDSAPMGATPVQCSVGVAHSGSGTVSLYQVETKDTAATSGTLIGTFTASTTSPTTFSPGLPYLKAVASSASSGTVMTVRCSNTQISSGGGGSGGILGWPSLQVLGGTGRPTQALVVDSLLANIVSGGPGRDDDGNLFSGGCVANDPADFPCILGAATSNIIDLAGTGINATLLNVDWTDPDIDTLCRNTTTDVHATGSGTDEICSAIDEMIPMVIRDDTDDSYRLTGVCGGSLSTASCSGLSGQFGTSNSLMYTPDGSDDMGLLYADGVHLGLYGGRHVADSLLNARLEWQRPEVLGVENGFTNGYMETNCSAGSPLSVTAGAATFNAVTRSATAPHQGPPVGQGCFISSVTAGTIMKTNTVTASPGDPIVVGFYAATNATGISTRSLHVRVEDNSGNAITDVNWFIQSPSNGRTDLVEDIDPDGHTSGQLDLNERDLYHGAMLVGLFEVENGDTGYYLEFETDDTHVVYFDEIWTRPSLFQGNDSHYLIQDGNAEIFTLTDSRGDGARLLEGMDYMLGYETDNGTRASSIRPNLYLGTKPSSNSWWLSGESLGDIVGGADGDLNNANAAISTKARDLIPDATTYCVSYYGVNGQVASLRPSSSALESDTANAYRYFLDQLRGFEMACEQKGAIPIILSDLPHRHNTSLNSCTNAAGSAMNCGLWYNELWKNGLQNKGFGLP